MAKTKEPALSRSRSANITRDAGPGTAGVNTRAVDLLLTHMATPGKRATARDASPVHGPSESTAKFALSYLDAFGYLKTELAEWKDIELGDILKAVGDFQGMFGLKRTKALDLKTVRAMEAPRCGCPDVVQARHAGARGLKDFVTANLPRWKKTGVTYAIADYLPGISKTDFEQAVDAAFRSWTPYGNVDVSRATQGTSDIVISVGRGAQSNFDGAGGTLAWAYLPDGGDNQLVMRFDLDETWILDPTQRGIVLHNVARHEFGHLLGLDHSRVQGALMAPYYNAAIRDPQQNDDIPRFQARYGVRTTPPAPPAGGGTAAGGTLVVEGSITSVTVGGKKVY